MQLRRQPRLLVLSVLCAMAIGSAALHAEPVTGQDDVSKEVNPPAPALVDLTELGKGELPLEEALSPAATITSPVGVVPMRRVTPATLAPEDDASLHKAIKEAVRPVYNELVESGALETWHDVKESLGLSSHNWDRAVDEDAIRMPQRTPMVNAPAWQDPAQPVKSAAQAQLDREYDAYLLRQLIDELKPWALGLVGLYALGYLTKLVFKLMQWKVARRRERRAQHARHHASHHRHGSKREL